MSELLHYGVKGMKWGVRRTPKELGHKNLKKAKTANLDKWGKDADHNVLYIAGYSGSGKSTTALSMAKQNDKVIHLDAYSEPVIVGTGRIELDNMNPDFNNYLDKHIPQWQDLIKATSTGKNGRLKRYSKEYWGMVNSFANGIEQYGKEQFLKGNRVIVEGVQIADGWLRNDKSYYLDKPMIILNTSSIKSFKQSSKRDYDGLLNRIKDIDDIRKYVEWYSDAHEKLNDLGNATNAKRGQQWVREYLRGLDK